MLRLIAIAVILSVFVIPAAAFAQESVAGTINGQVINGTEGGSITAGVEITLLTYVNDALAGTMTTRTDEEGRFQFDVASTEHTYLVSARYREVDYYYLVVFEPGETVTYIEVGVCDTTTSDEAIRVGLAHAIISVEEESIQVSQVYWLVNDEDRTYVGTDHVLVFTLPDGAYGFNAPQELMLDYQLLDDNKVTYLVPFPPGERQLIFSYKLAKPDSNDLGIPLAIDYPTNSFELMVGGEDIEVIVGQLAPAEPVLADTGERFIHFQGSGFARGNVINVAISGLLAARSLPYVILSVIITAVAVIIVVYMVRRTKRVARDE